MSKPPPEATLGIDCWMTNPPRPLQCGVIVDGKIIALISLDELHLAAKRLDELEAQRAMADKKI